MDRATYVPESTYTIILLLRNFIAQLFANVSLSDSCRKLSSILPLSFSSESMNVVEITLLILFQINSMGLRSGEYGGKNMRLISRRRAVSFTILE